jgi:hypothetical protein
MVHVCILTISEKEKPDLFKQVIDTCNYCVSNDKTKTFTYETQPGGEGIKIFCPMGRDQAMKRGVFFNKKHGVHFEVIWQK